MACLLMVIPYYICTMEKIILDVSDKKGGHLEVDAAISFKPFIDHLRKSVKEEGTARASFYKSVLTLFESYDVYDKDIALENIYEYSELLEQIFVCLAPPMIAEKDLAWGISSPLPPVVFYGTGLMYELLQNRKDEKDVYVDSKKSGDYRKERLHFIYSLIFKRLYNFRIPSLGDQYHAGINTETGLLQYYAVHLNTDFMEVTAKAELPQVDFRQLHAHIKEGIEYEVLETLLPLSLFHFSGICVLTVSDVTAQKAVENIDNNRLSRTLSNDLTSYKNVIQSLKTLVGSNKIEFDLFPFVKVNNEPVYGYAKGGTGILFKVWGEQRLSPELFRKYAKSYFSNPNAFFSPDISKEEDQAYSFLTHFSQLGVRSLALLPVFYDHKPVGVLAIHTWGDDTFDEATLAVLEPAIPAIARLQQIYIDEFNLEIENIIKEKFTSIQPAVQWKFNEVAWHYLHDRKKGLPEKIEKIQFCDVYPLYGAVDIRNSTIERNNAIIADLDNQLNLLTSTLDALQQEHGSVLLEEMIYKCGKWHDTLAQGQLNANDENRLTLFFREEAAPYLTHLLLGEQNGNSTIVEDYLAAFRDFNSTEYGNKHALEVSMQMINTVINNYFETEKEQLQYLYPCYFEKFRTDGVEYDIYIGQSLAPNKPFSHFHLKNLRLWQLSSMAAIARLTHSLLPSMPKPLQTTQLIFVHNHTIDISFRADERKFDVEGAYNIRYQMIKKRIDKVHVRDTKERLTQPDKIVLIYFDEKDVEDYLPFIQYLQEKGTLCNDLEAVVLEDLQGLSGLKALRVGVAMDDLPIEV